MYILVKVFGENLVTSGAHGDIKFATSEAWNYVGHYGFDGFASYITSTDEKSDGCVFNRKQIGEVVEGLLKDAKEKAKSLIHTNLQFFQSSLEYLLYNKKISSKEFSEIAKKFNIHLKEIKTGESIILGYEEMTKKFLSKKK